MIEENGQVMRISTSTAGPPRNIRRSMAKEKTPFKDLLNDNTLQNEDIIEEEDDDNTTDFLFSDLMERDANSEDEKFIIEDGQIENTRLAPVFPECLNKFIPKIEVPELKDYIKPLVCPLPPIEIEETA